MAWPCISRVCCLARFWNQFDKSDLSVPLTIQNYSDIAAEQEVRSVTKQVAASERAPAEERTSPEPRDGPGARGSFRARREPSYKPRDDYRPPGVPFPSVTQYKQDFKPWPIPRKDNFPWISNGGGRADGAPDAQPHSQGDRGQQGGEESKTSSYRQEYRPWTGVRPAKSAKKHPPAQYSSHGTEAAHVHPETSYQAAFSAEAHRSRPPHGENPILPSTSSNVQPAAVPLQAAAASSPPGLQQSVLPERTELSETSKGDEHLVRTKLPPNPSAVFQGGPRVFNI